ARGFAPGDSTVTVYASNSLYQVYNQLAAAPEPLLACLAGALGNVGAPNVKGFNQTLVVLAGEHAEILRASGWRRADVQRFLLKLAERLGRRHGATVTLISRKRSPSHEIDEAAVKALRSQADLVVSGIGD